MKTLDTTPGSEYAVKSAAGCDVYTPSGQVICRIMPGILGSFCASTYVTCFSDAAAEVTLVSSGAAGGTGGDTLTISQALAAANRAESAADRAEAGASAAELQAQGATVANTAARAALAGAQAAETNAAASAQASATSEANATAAAQASATSEANAAASAQASATSEANAAASADRAETAQVAAQASENNAAASADRAADAQAAAELAAATAQAPESLAVRAARPATMVLLRGELEALLGSSAAWRVDTDGQKIIVHTDRLEGEQLAAVEDMLGRFVPQFIEVVRYNHHIEVSWRALSRYSACKNVAEMNAVAQTYGFSSFKDDLTSDGWWVYPLDSIVGANFGNSFFGSWSAAAASTKIRHAYLYLPNVNKQFVGASLVANCKNLEYIYLYAPGLWTNCSRVAANCSKLTFFEAYVPNIYRIDEWCAGCTSLGHFRFLAPLIEGGLAGGNYTARIWDGCVLDVASVQNIAENLPTMPSLTTTTIGIDEAFQNDEAMLEALALLESKNWNIEVQTNASPVSTVSSTYSLRGKTIYAKVVEIEGVRKLCWGHYVTNETGYETFRSLESAYEYFGLPMPEEDLAATE